MTYSIIKNCNYDRDSAILRATKAVEKGYIAGEQFDAPDALVEALDALEETLAEHAESQRPQSVAACERAERAVERAWSGAQSA